MKTSIAAAVIMLVILTIILASGCANYRAFTPEEAYINHLQTQQSLNYQKNFEDSYSKMSNDMRDTQRLQMEQGNRTLGYPVQPILIIPNY